MKPIKAFLLLVLLYLTTEAKLKLKTKRTSLMTVQSCIAVYLFGEGAQAVKDATKFCENSRAKYLSSTYKNIEISGASDCYPCNGPVKGKLQICHDRQEYNTKYVYCTTTLSACKSMMNYYKGDCYQDRAAVSTGDDRYCIY